MGDTGDRQVNSKNSPENGVGPGKVQKNGASGRGTRWWAVGGPGDGREFWVSNVDDLRWVLETFRCQYRVDEPNRRVIYRDLSDDFGIRPSPTYPCLALAGAVKEKV